MREQHAWNVRFDIDREGSKYRLNRNEVVIAENIAHALNAVMVKYADKNPKPWGVSHIGVALLPALNEPPSIEEIG